MIQPAFDAFASGYAEGRAQLLYTRLVADLETPVSAFLKLGFDNGSGGKGNAFLLESVQGGETRGRYSIIGLKPDLIWRCREGKAEINRRARSEAGKFMPDSNAERPLAALRALIKECRVTLPPEVPPMAVGLYGYLGYDMV